MNIKATSVRGEGEKKKTKLSARYLSGQKLKKKTTTTKHASEKGSRKSRERHSVPEQLADLDQAKPLLFYINTAKAPSSWLLCYSGWDCKSIGA